MNARLPLPRDLQIVAWLFLLHGLISLAGTVWSVINLNVNVDLGLLGIPAFLGLRRRGRGWRIFALVYLGLNLLALLVVLGVVLFSSQPPSIHIGGVAVPKDWMPSYIAAAAALALALLIAWMLRVLTRRQIRRLFAPPPLPAC